MINININTKESSNTQAVQMLTPDLMLNFEIALHVDTHTLCGSMVVNKMFSNGRQLKVYTPEAFANKEHRVLRMTLK